MPKRRTSNAAVRAAQHYHDRHSAEWPLNPRVPYSPALHQSILDADRMLLSLLVARSKQRAEQSIIEEQLKVVRRKVASKKAEDEETEVELEELVGA